MLFGKSFFRGTEQQGDKLYADGVSAMKARDHYRADKLWRDAAEKGHLSAIFNLATLHGSGVVSPYDINLAAGCWTQAAEAGHPTATQRLPMLQAADRGAFGTVALAEFAARSQPQTGLNSIIMVCACRYFAVVAGQHGVIEELLAYELAFAALGAEEARAFVARTGVPQAVLRDPKARNLEPGSAADQLNEGITAFYMGMKQAGYSDDLCLFARCTIVGYLASHSKFASLGEPLRGLDTFYK